MSEVTTVPIRVVSVAQQGPAGPAGPAGPGFESRMGNAYIPFPESGTIPIVPSSAYAFDIQGVRGIKVAAGTLTISFKINGTDIDGLSGISVGTSAQDLTANAANAIAAGGRLTMVLADVSGTGLEFTLY